MHRLFHILLFLLPLASVGQNLVVNGSFEDVVSCDFSSGINYAPDWTNLYPEQNSNGADLFGPCSVDPVFLAPASTWGYQPAMEGANYAGFIPYGQNESLRGSLISPLIEDSIYSVEFFLNLMNISGKAVAGLGLVFFDSPVALSVASYDTLMPDIIESDFITDTLDWTRVNGFYVASGGESYFAIGLFDTVVVSNTYYGPGQAYYYVDAVNVHMASQSEINGIQEPKLTFSIYPNPATTNLTIESRTPLAQVWVRDVAGRAIMNETLRSAQSDKKTLDVSSLPSGIYLVEVLTQNGQRSVQKVVVE
jgi:hypothetical protein